MLLDGFLTEAFLARTAIDDVPIGQMARIFAWAIWPALFGITLLGIAGCLWRRKFRVVVVYLLTSPVIVIAGLVLKIPLMALLIYFTGAAAFLILKGGVAFLNVPDDDF